MPDSQASQSCVSVLRKQTAHRECAVKIQVLMLKGSRGRELFT